MRLHDTEGNQVESLYHLRLDPEQFTFQVAYHPGRPQTLAEWQAETGALIILNGGFFTPEFLATGLTVVEGQVYGKSFEGFGGMLTFDANGLQIQSLREYPYDPSSPPHYALQSFPILVQSGRSVYENEEQSAARRTAIALDRQGRLLIILASWGHFPLAEFGRYLEHSDLDIDVALNLDGGASTGLLVAQPEEGIPNYSPLPVVIAVFRR